MREVTTHELVRCEFSLEEVQQRAQSLARANQQHNQLEAEKKQVMSDYKSRLEAISSEILMLSSSVAMGYEMRRLECAVIYNSPTSGEKTLIRRDTGEIVRVARMTTEEMQEVFPFEPPKEEPKPNGSTSTEVATLHSEAPLEEQMFAFTGKVTRMAVRVYRTRQGWHWMYGMTDGNSNATSVSSETPLASKGEAIGAGAKSLHDAVELAFRRNNKKLTVDRKEDARNCMEWASRIAADPTLAEDFCATGEELLQINPPEDGGTEADHGSIH